MISYMARFDKDPDSGGYTVTFPDFGWGVTQGRDLVHAMGRAQDLLHDLLAHLIARNEPIPEPAAAKGRGLRRISLPPIDSAKVELYRQLLASGVQKAAFARRMGIPRANVNRLLDLDHATPFESLDRAFFALGKRLVIQIEDAA